MKKTAPFAPVVRNAMRRISAAGTRAENWLSADLIRILTAALVLIVCLRYISYDWFPLLDRTEAGTALVSMNMYNSGQYLSPTTSVHGTPAPYLSKPPLHFWLATAALASGKDLMAVRWVPLLSSLVTVLLTGFLAKRLFGSRTALLSMLILSSSVLFFMLSAIAIVDAIFVTWMTVTCTFLFLILVDDSLTRHQRTLSIFLGVSLGLAFCTKGPVALALSAVACGGFAAWEKNLESLRKIKWKPASISFLIIAVPVYLLMEYKNPGFIRYFLINENLLRYIMHDYGDCIGSGHKQIYGMSWVFLLIGSLPWSLCCVREGLKSIINPTRNRPQRLLICIGLAPAVFFTFARNHLATYLLPGYPALSILAAGYLCRSDFGSGALRVLRKALPFLAMVTGFSALIVSLFLGPSIKYFLLGCFFFIPFVFVLRKTNRTETVEGWSAGIAVITALMLTIACAASTRWAHGIFSSEDLISKLEREVTNRRTRIIFPLGVPYSGIIYSSKPLETGFSLTEGSSNQRVVYVVREKDQRKLFRLARFRNLQTLFKEGKWVVLEAKTQLHERKS